MDTHTHIDGGQNQRKLDNGQQINEQLKRGGGQSVRMEVSGAEEGVAAATPVAGKHMQFEDSGAHRGIMM